MYIIFPPPDEVCADGTTGTPPNCKPIPPLPPDCDVVNPPAVCPEPPICTEPECASTECPDGRIVPPGEECPDNPPGDDPPGDDPPGDDPPGDTGDTHLEEMEMEMEETTTVTPLEETLSLIRT